MQHWEILLVNMVLCFFRRVSGTRLATTTGIPISTSNHNDHHHTACGCSVCEHAFRWVPSQYGLPTLPDAHYYMHHVSRWDLDMACRWGSLPLRVRFFWICTKRIFLVCTCVFVVGKFRGQLHGEFQPGLKFRPGQLLLFSVWAESQTRACVLCFLC